jgi:hypothetical protein
LFNELPRFFHETLGISHAVKLSEGKMGGRDSKPDFHINLNGKCVLNPKNGITDFDRSPHILMGSDFHETLLNVVT